MYFYEGTQNQYPYSEEYVIVPVKLFKRAFEGVNPRQSQTLGAQIRTLREDRRRYTKGSILIKAEATIVASVASFQRRAYS